MIHKSFMILAAMMIITSQARTFCVGKTGNDSNNPCTRDTPWLTIT